MTRASAISISMAGLSFVLLMAGCGGSSTSSTTTPTNPINPTGPTKNTGAAMRVYVVQQSGSSAGTILQFSATASGSVSPASTIAPNTAVSQVATDSYGNIYFFNGNVVEYAAGSTGSPTATRQITAGSATRICCLDGLGVGPEGNILMGQDNGEVDEWSSTATGSVAPTRYILGYSEMGGGASPVVVANQVTVDASDNIYVGAGGGPGVAQAVVFGPSASGNVAPIRSVGPNGLAGGLAVDSSGNVYITSSSCTYSTGPSGTCTGTISVYAAGTTSTSTPTRVITGSATKLGLLAQIKVDAVGNIYVVSTTAAGTSPTVVTFAANANGNVAPASSFTSTAWTSPDFNPSIAIY